MAERAVNRLQRILRATVGFGLAETDVRQFTLDGFDDARIHHRLRSAVAGVVREPGQIRVLVFEMAQNVLQPFLDAPEITALSGSRAAGSFQALQQIGHALFEMGECRSVVGAGRDAIQPFGQRAQRAFEKFRIVACDRPLARFDRRRQRGNALFDAGQRIAVVAGAG